MSNTRRRSFRKEFKGLSLDTIVSVKDTTVATLKTIQNTVEVASVAVEMVKSELEMIRDVRATSLEGRMDYAKKSALLENKIALKELELELAEFDSETPTA